MDEDERAERCQTCRFFEARVGPDACGDGYCRRYPPVLIPNAVELQPEFGEFAKKHPEIAECAPTEAAAELLCWAHPAVNAEHWCGEWQQKPQEGAT